MKEMLGGLNDDFRQRSVWRWQKGSNREVLTTEVSNVKVLGDKSACAAVGGANDQLAAARGKDNNVPF